MKNPVWLASALLTLCLVLGGGEAARADEPITVSLDRPDPFQPAFGEVVIEAVVVSPEPLERVVFHVDGVAVGELAEPPWRFETHLGDDVGEHRFDVVAYGRSGATGSGGLTTPGIRIDDELDIGLQQLYVTVTRGGVRQLDLDRDDFVVLDDQASQRLVTFERGNIPFTALVLVDSSTSMRGEKLVSALRGAQTFFDGMRPLDEGKLMVFSDRVLHVTPFTTYPAILGAGLAGVEAEGGTALADHLYLALQQLEERQGRRVVLLLTDGVDSHSVLVMGDVLRLARRSQALIYWLRLPYRAGRPADEMPAVRTAWHDAEDYQREITTLEKTVLESGGAIQPLGTLEEIAPAFGEILAELREQYVLGYYPSTSRRDGRWHRVRVRVDLAGAEVRTRGGYLDF